MFQFPGFASLAGYPCGWVSPFGDTRIKACSQLPMSYRSVPRPSSPLSAKASTECPSFTSSLSLSMPTVQAPPELCYTAAAVVYNCGSGTTHSDLADLQAGTSSHIVRGQRLQTITVHDTGEDPGIPQQPRTSGTMCGKTSLFTSFNRRQRG